MIEYADSDWPSINRRRGELIDKKIARTIMLCHSAPAETSLCVMPCPVCRCRRRMKMTFFEWYTPSMKCSKCRTCFSWDEDRECWSYELKGR